MRARYPFTPPSYGFRPGSTQEVSIRSSRSRPVWPGDARRRRGCEPQLTGALPAGQPSFMWACRSTGGLLPCKQRMRVQFPLGPPNLCLAGVITRTVRGCWYPVQIAAAEGGPPCPETGGTKFMRLSSNGRKRRCHRFSAGSIPASRSRLSLRSSRSRAPA